ncbi:IQ domain-containing protein IQM2 [Citrus sinensis]|uniref:IQ domain-containing protein IQM2 n=1 Tax=Citrus sinensis TaxID=2711 RepID=A0ACB8MTN0_CITSI|nr:IQ domain-containing protein IQM2 [Citrus sinensis]KAH9789151.1 IQ domain-containing protein IQM2 [Citrus sinensis]
MISRTSSLSSDKEKDESIRSIRIKVNEMDNQSPRSEDSMETIQQFPILDPNNPKHEAAIKLQKVYKSFRTRRKLADCAVIVEQSWWKLLDFAELKRSSISFFDIEKNETAISRWSRARTRAAKVGKGLSKNDRAQKLALQHWLEAIDPRHRYGHNLHFYYDKWLHSHSREPFFYWVDIGEGREVNLVDKCPRWKLHQQCIKYLGPMERKPYEVIVKDGKFFYKQSGLILDTNVDIDSKWIFVLSTTKSLYHSSFLAGGATTAAGRLVVESGVLKAVWPHSGHYRPTEQNFNDFISFLKENNVDLTDVKLLERPESNIPAFKPSSNNPSVESQMNVPGSVEGAYVSKPEIKNSKQELSNDEDAENEVEPVPEEAILQRINSRKGMKSYQLGKQLSCKWTTGAGPRIGCVRDYPCQLQFRALEQLNLSPTSAGYSRSRSSPHTIGRYNPLMPSPLHPHMKMEATVSLPVPGKGNSLIEAVRLCRTQSSPLEDQ